MKFEVVYLDKSNNRETAHFYLEQEKPDFFDFCREFMSWFWEDISWIVSITRIED